MGLSGFELPRLGVYVLPVSLIEWLRVAETLKLEEMIKPRTAPSVSLPTFVVDFVIGEFSFKLLAQLCPCAPQLT